MIERKRDEQSKSYGIIIVVHEKEKKTGKKERRYSRFVL